MEPQGYLNINNERKAVRVRNINRLIIEGNLERDFEKQLEEESDKLSNELMYYLVSTYPDRFGVYLFEVDSFIELDNLNDPLSYLIKNYPDINELPLHAIGIIVARGKYREFTIGYVIFHSDRGLDIIRYRGTRELEMPDSFYDFLEKAGLGLVQTMDLYDLESISNKKGYENFPLQIEQRIDKWPHTVTLKDKLI